MVLSRLKKGTENVVDNITDDTKKVAISLAKKSLNRLKKEAKDPDNKAQVKRLANGVINQLKKYKSDPKVKSLIVETREFLSEPETYVHEYPCSNSIWDFILPLLVVMIIICIIMSCMKNK
jgi:ElaB/YqjD/DUF883 family membrane-anchored ribosome-binding protein